MEETKLYPWHPGLCVLGAHTEEGTVLAPVNDF